jgi:predicted nucleic acid-binding protein
VPDGPLPPDPFTATDAGYVIIVTEYRALRKAGAGMVAAALITAAHAVINGMAVREQEKPEA